MHGAVACGNPACEAKIMKLTQEKDNLTQKLYEIKHDLSCCKMSKDEKVAKLEKVQVSVQTQTNEP